MAGAIAPGFYPFWFWNDAVEEAEIRRQIAEMAAQGIKGFYIHPRQGLTVPYLSEAFMKRVEVALDEASRRGLTVHLYDEYPYPSGVAGGMVILGQPQYMATRLVQRIFDLPGGRVRLELPRGKVLSCVAYPVTGQGVDWERGIDLAGSTGVVLSEESYVETGLTAYNQKRYFASDPVPVLDAALPDRPFRLYVSVQALVEGHKYWGGFVDVLNPEAVEEFLRLTHERYWARFAHAFGREILSIFLDETEPGWSERIPKAFRAEYGYDLIPLLPALADPAHPDHLQVAKDLHRLRYKMFLASFEGPISRWCQEHGLLYAAEKPNLRFSQLRYAGIPGCEPGHTKAGAKMDILRPALRSNARAAASAAYFYGKPCALCECYHSVGWSATLQDAKLIAEGLLLMGVTMLVPHGFFYSTHALKKHDAPPSFFFQMPYWPLFGCLSRRVDEIARAFGESHIDAELLVIDPTPGLPQKDEQEAYGRLLDLLMRLHVDFLIADTDVLEAGTIRPVSSLGAQDRVRVAGAADVYGEPERQAVLELRDLVVKLIVVPPVRVVEEELERALRRFEDAGGAVLRLEVDFDESQVSRRILEVVQPHLPLVVTGGDESALYTVTRKRGERRLWFLLNTGRTPLEVAIETDRSMVEVALETGSPPVLERCERGYRRTIAPLESLILAEAGGCESGRPGPDALQRARIVPILLRGPVRVIPKSLNLLRLDRWELALLGQSGEVLERALTRPMPIANQLAETKIPIAPRVCQVFGQAPRLELPRLSLRYTASFDVEYRGQVWLVVEPGSLAGDWRIFVNGRGSIRPEDLRPVDAHVRGSLGAEITQFLLPGENELAVELVTDRRDGGLVNPLYLAGDFGVRLSPPVLAPRPDVGAFDAWEDNGLPHYAGVVEYLGECEVPPKVLARGEGEPLVGELDLGVPFDDACEVSLNGGPWRALPWSPRRWSLLPGEVKPGTNRIAVRVYTSLIRAFEGRSFEIESHGYREIG